MSDSFERNIQKWVNIDNQLKIINEKAKELRDEKNELLEDINIYIDTNKLNNASIDISDGKLRFAQIHFSNLLIVKFKFAQIRFVVRFVYTVSCRFFNLQSSKLKFAQIRF